MLAVRPAGPDDYQALHELAVLSGRGFTSLPEDEPTLRGRLEVSAASFAGALAPVEAWYTLMLDDTATGEVVGVCSVKAAVGLKRPFFSFRRVTLAQHSAATGARFDHGALVLVNECAGWTEVGSLFLRPERRRGGAGALLALSRYLLIAAEPTRFADQVLAELRGWFDEDGACPFWEAVGCKFFRLPFDQADLMSASTDGQFILDLAPRHPIYLELLPERAREAVGRVHREGEAARALLQREGFRVTGLVDIFDGGPTVSCPRDDLRTLSESRAVRLDGEPAAPGSAVRLVALDRIEGFRAVRTPAELDGDTVRLPPEAVAALRVAPGERLRVRP